MSYVDGCVIPVATENKEKYIAYAMKVSDLFIRHGALNVVDTWGHDVPEGKVTSFPMAVKCKPDETVVFSWIIWPSYEARELGFKNAMAEMTTLNEEMKMPFDGQRMIFGGFSMIVNKTK
jgi:uncharacterized protein YbaA (DUF1428 family)